jgi:DNA (cytosine-5)-methyltransferase 1
MTHDEGKTLQSVLDVLSLDRTYSLHHRLLNAWDYGVPQKRERIFIVGVRGDISISISESFTFPRPSARQRPTLHDVLFDVPETEATKGAQYSANKRAIFGLIPPGGCWVDLPTEALKEAYMGKSYHASGGRRGVLRRLSLDRPAPTLLCNPQAKQSELCHPLETRPLSVREYARVQSFPDTHTFCGSVASQYKQIGNAVPVSMAYHVGLAIRSFLENKNENENENENAATGSPVGDQRSAN